MSGDNEHRRLRQRVTVRLGRAVSDAAWEMARDERFVGDALDREYARGEDLLVDYLSRLLHVVDAGPAGIPRRRKPDTVTDVPAPAYLLPRIEAVSRLAAEAAAGDGAVLAFRRTILGRHAPLSPDEAEAYRDDDGARSAPRRATSRGPDVVFEYQNRRVHHTLHVWSDSPLDKLRRLATTLTESYPWVPEQAAAFVLEGLTPRATPFMLRFPQPVHEDRPRRARVVMEIDLWMPAERVLKTYRELQRAVLPGHNKPISRRSIDLVNFVMQHRPATWPELLTAWNNEHPSGTYRDYRRMRTAFERASTALLAPRYRTYLPTGGW
jgi:hypothetical protein